MTLPELKEFLDEKVDFYNQTRFIETDPIQIPHQFQLKEDIEISGFLTASIAWGNRKSITNSANKIIEYMGNSPYDFVLNHLEKDLDCFNSFVHRTFNSTDITYFIKALKHIYKHHGGIENVFYLGSLHQDLQFSIHHFKQLFFSLNHPSRTTKHISDPLKNSAAKRMNMFLRWMVRKDSKGVDFGIWKSISPALLSCPLDVHSGRVARKLNLLTKKQNDAKALRELDSMLRKLDAEDPAKYDFALFGLGVFESF